MGRLRGNIDTPPRREVGRWGRLGTGRVQVRPRNVLLVVWRIYIFFCEDGAGKGHS